MIRHALAALLVASGTAAPAAPPPASPFNDRLMALSPVQQRAAMRQAVTNNGQRCGRVETTRFQQPHGNLMMWTALCVPGGRYAIYVGRDASVQVRPCADLPKLKLPPCAAVAPAGRQRA